MARDSSPSDPGDEDIPRFEGPGSVSEEVFQDLLQGGVLEDQSLPSSEPLSWEFSEVLSRQSFEKSAPASPVQPPPRGPASEEPEVVARAAPSLESLTEETRAYRPRRRAPELSLEGRVSAFSAGVALLGASIVGAVSLQAWVSPPEVADLTFEPLEFARTLAQEAPEESLHELLQRLEGLARQKPETWLRFYDLVEGPGRALYLARHLSGGDRREKPLGPGRAPDFEGFEAKVALLGMPPVFPFAAGDPPRLSSQQFLRQLSGLRAQKGDLGSIRRRLLELLRGVRQSSDGAVLRGLIDFALEDPRRIRDLAFLRPEAILGYPAERDSAESKALRRVLHFFRVEARGRLGQFEKAEAGTVLQSLQDPKLWPGDLEPVREKLWAWTYVLAGQKRAVLKVLAEGPDSLASKEARGHWKGLDRGLPFSEFAKSLPAYSTLSSQRSKGETWAPPAPDRSLIQSYRRTRRPVP